MSPYRTAAPRVSDEPRSVRDDSALLKGQLWVLWFDWTLCVLRIASGVLHREASVEVLGSVLIGAILTLGIRCIGRDLARTRTAREGVASRAPGRFEELRP